MMTTMDPSVNAAILLATLPSLSTPHFLGPVITHAATHTKNRLIIVLFSRHFNVQRSDPGDYLSFPEIQSLSRTESWHPVQRILTFTYVQATKAAQVHGNVLMCVDVLLKGLNEDLDPDIANNIDICFRVTGDSIAVPLPSSIGLLRQLYLRPGDIHSESRVPTATGTPHITEHTMPPLYPTTALGGTFDHLHAGHKILLSMAAYITSKKLIVGITEDALLQNKSNRHILEPLPVRSEHVRSFVHFFKSSLQISIVPIHDVYGPTGWDPDIQALVVSKETLGGAKAIASHRASHSLPSLQTFLIDVISATNASLDHEDADWLKEHKLSSTFIRQWIVDRGLDGGVGAGGGGGEEGKEEEEGKVKGGKEETGTQKKKPEKEGEGTEGTEKDKQAPVTPKSETRADSTKQ